MPRLVARTQTPSAQVGVAAARLPKEAQTTARMVAEGGVVIFRAFAPRKSGKLRRGIHVVSKGGAYTVRADAKGQGGYDYVGVTRRGHKLRVIRPRHAKALRFVVNGRVLYRTHVKGYKPTGDWAQRAYPAVRKLARSRLTRLAQRIESWLR